VNQFPHQFGVLFKGWKESQPEIKDLKPQVPYVTKNHELEDRTPTFCFRPTTGPVAEPLSGLLTSPHRTTFGGKRQRANDGWMVSAGNSADFTLW
jgi:hypothetical protein